VGTKSVPTLIFDSALKKRQNPRLIIGRAVEKTCPP